MPENIYPEIYGDPDIYQGIYGDDAPTGLALGLVRHYKLEEITGTNAVDDGSDGSDGTYQRDASNTTGDSVIESLGKSYNTNGSTDYITLPTISFANEFTICFFGKRFTTSVFHPAIGNLGANNYGGLNSNSTQWAMRLVPSGSQVLVNHGVDTLEWHSFIFGRDENDDAFLYVDGESVAVSLNTAGASVWDCIASYSTPSGWYRGWLDDVRFYNRVLTASEVRQYHALGFGGDTWLNRRFQQLNIPSVS